MYVNFLKQLHLAIKVRTGQRDKRGRKCRNTRKDCNKNDNHPWMHPLLILDLIFSFVFFTHTTSYFVKLLVIFHQLSESIHSFKHSEIWLRNFEYAAISCRAVIQMTPFDEYFSTCTVQWFCSQQCMTYRSNISRDVLPVDSFVTVSRRASKVPQ